MRPRHRVGNWRGEAVHGGAGEMRYEHESGTMTVHVAPMGAGGANWTVAADHQGTGRPGTLDEGLNKDEAFERAYGFMEGFDHAIQRHGYSGGSGMGGNWL